MKGLSIGEKLKQITTIEFLNDLEYATSVMMEPLRMQCPGSITSFGSMAKTLKLGDITILGGDEFSVHLEGLAKNPTEWPNPEEFIPERFDPSHEASKTKNGGKRSPASMCVFS